MRLLSALLLFTLLAPLAAADQHITAGPADVRTTSATYGGSCASGNGTETHTVDAKATLPSDAIDVQYTEFCSTYTSGSYSQSGQGQFVSASRTHGASGGPYVSYYWSTFQNSQGASYCGDTAYVSGVSIYLGCILSTLPPTPIGSYLP